MEGPAISGHQFRPVPAVDDPPGADPIGLSRGEVIIELAAGKTSEPHSLDQDRRGDAHSIARDGSPTRSIPVTFDIAS